MTDKSVSAGCGSPKCPHCNAPLAGSGSPDDCVYAPVSTDSLVARLRTKSYNDLANRLMHEAADTIERLEAEKKSEFVKGIAVALVELISVYDQPTMASNIIKALGLEVVDFQDCEKDYHTIRKAVRK